MLQLDLGGLREGRHRHLGDRDRLTLQERRRARRVGRRGLQLLVVLERLLELALGVEDLGLHEHGPVAHHAGAGVGVRPVVERLQPVAHDERLVELPLSELREGDRVVVSVHVLRLRVAQGRRAGGPLGQEVAPRFQVGAPEREGREVGVLVGREPGEGPLEGGRALRQRLRPGQLPLLFVRLERRVLRRPIEPHREAVEHLPVERAVGMVREQPLHLLRGLPGAAQAVQRAHHVGFLEEVGVARPRVDLHRPLVLFHVRVGEAHRPDPVERHDFAGRLLLQDLEKPDHGLGLLELDRRIGQHPRRLDHRGVQERPLLEKRREGLPRLLPPLLSVVDPAGGEALAVGDLPARPIIHAGRQDVELGIRPGRVGVGPHRDRHLMLGARLRGNEHAERVGPHPEARHARELQHRVARRRAAHREFVVDRERLSRGDLRHRGVLDRLLRRHRAAPRRRALDDERGPEGRPLDRDLDGRLGSLPRLAPRQGVVGPAAHRLDRGLPDGDFPVPLHREAVDLELGDRALVVRRLHRESQHRPLEGRRGSARQEPRPGLREHGVRRLDLRQREGRQRGGPIGGVRAVRRSHLDRIPMVLLRGLDQPGDGRLRLVGLPRPLERQRHGGERARREAVRPPPEAEDEAVLRLAPAGERE